MKKLNTPVKIQNFIDKIPFNFTRKTSYLPPQKVLEENRAHCFEGAALACFLLQKIGIKNYLLDLKVKDLRKDSDHTVCIFKLNGYWGAISKTNHSVLRWRDPIYKSYRELALSYFHEYFLDSGKKTLASFSKPFDVWKRFGKDWAQKYDDLTDLAISVDESVHLPFVPKKNLKFIKKAGRTEIKGAAVTQWRKSG